MRIGLRKKLVLLIALMSYLLTALDNSLVLTSLTRIQADLHLSQISLSWIQDAYGLAFGSFILLSGRLGDMYGRKLMMEIALGLFAISSLVTAISTAAAMTIASRFVQGMGAAILAPTSLALLVDYFTELMLSKAIAWYSSIAGLGMSIGLILGGILTSYLNWRVGFYLNAAVALGLFILSVKTLEQKQAVQTDSRIDILGSLASVIGSGLLVYAVNGARQMVPFMIAALVILAGLFVIEKRVDNPVLPLKLIANRGRLLADLSRAFLVAAAMGFYFFDSEFLQEVLHYSPLLTGLAYLPMTITLFVVAILVPRMVEKLDNQAVLLSGSVVIMLAFVWAVFVDGNNYLTTLLVPELLLGVGQGLALAPQTNLAINGVKPQESGAASGILNMFHQLGGVLGIAVMVQMGIKLGNGQNFAGQFQLAMIAGLVIAVLLVLMSILIYFNREGRK